MAYDRKDHLHQRAKREGFRSRAAYKLRELDRSQRLLRSGQTVVDLGCWPGGWLQVAAAKVGPRGRVVGVDLAAVDDELAGENANMVAIQADLEDADVASRIRTALGRDRADLLLSDAAPKITGLRDRDRALEERLLEAVEKLIPELLRKDGSLVLKLLESPEAQAVAARIKRSFKKAKQTRLASTRKGSSERYLVAAGYQGPGD